jgi:DNA-binding response OmpR family regulator
MNCKKILIVDDNEVILKSFSLKLKANNYDVVTAMDGSQAMTAARQEKPDLILLDITFPPDVAHGGGVPWDGFRIIQWLRRMEEAKTVPIIVVTSGEAPQYKDRALSAGAMAFFQKPVNNEELLATIQQALNDKPAAAAPAGRK